MPTDRTVSTIVVVGSDDIAGSIGKPGFLNDHLKPMTDSAVTVDVVGIEGWRCDVLAQRLDGPTEPLDNVPARLEPAFESMTSPLDIPGTTVLFIMSMAPVVDTVVLAHRHTGLLIQPPADFLDSLTDDEAAWIDETFERSIASDDEMAGALRTIAAALEPAGAELVIYNTSTFIPAERHYWYRSGDPETLTVRATRANLAVDKLIKELDITLVDVDRITAELGAGQAVTAPATYSPETLDALSEEAISMLLDLETISERFASDAMRLLVPRYDRRTTRATLTQWHISPGTEIARGDALFDLRFSNLHSTLDNDGKETDKAINLSVLAGRSGYVESVTEAEGANLAVGDLVGVVTTAPGIVYDNVDNAAHFPVGVKVEARDDG